MERISLERSCLPVSGDGKARIQTPSTPFRRHWAHAKAPSSPVDTPRFLSPLSAQFRLGRTWRGFINVLQESTRGRKTPWEPVEAVAGETARFPYLGLIASSVSSPTYRHAHRTETMYRGNWAQFRGDNICLLAFLR